MRDNIHSILISCSFFFPKIFYIVCNLHKQFHRGRSFYNIRHKEEQHSLAIAFYFRIFYRKQGYIVEVYPYFLLHMIDIDQTTHKDRVWLFAKFLGTENMRLQYI